MSSPESADARKELEQWAIKTTRALKDSAKRKNRVRAMTMGGGQSASIARAGVVPLLDDEARKRQEQIDERVGPRLPQSHGAQLAWLVGGLRPGTWHAFRVAAGNRLGESPMSSATIFVRTQRKFCVMVVMVAMGDD